jgi:hypothetical protein
MPCRKCGRPVADQAKRCLYCGTYRITAQPGTPEYDAELQAAEDDAKRVERQRLIFSHGVGLGKRDAKPSFTEQLRSASLPVRFGAALLAIPLLVVWPPLAIKWLKELFVA